MPDEVPDTIDRRRFLTVLGVTGAGAAALSGCSTDRIEKLVPYLVQSEDQVPGIATYYASTCTECAAACGLHVKTREGRAIKLDGNPEHPVNRGRLCSLGQSSLQALYNPGRLRNPMLRDGNGFKAITWDEAIAKLAEAVGGSSGRIAAISGAPRGTFSDLLADWTGALGGRVVRYNPLDHEALRAANKSVFGRDEVPAYDFAAAKYILSFGADFLETWVSPVESQLGYAASHGSGEGTMARHVAFTPRMGLTGMNADHWYPVKPGTETAVVLAMCNVILGERSGAPSDAYGLRGALGEWTPEQASAESGVGAEVIRRVAREFAAEGPGLAVAGGAGAQSPGAVQLCAAVNLLNYIAGNVGKTVKFGADLDTGDGYGALRDLMAGMDAGQVDVLIVHESNPVYTVPKSAGFAGKLAKVRFKVSTSLFMDETAAGCDLLLPGRHALERWDDVRPRAGIHALIQPAMEPVFGHVPGEAGTVATGDVLLRTAKAVGGPLARFDAPDYETHLRQAWTAAGRGSQDAWRAALARGGVYEPAPAVPVSLASTAVSYTPPAFDGDGEFVFSAFPTSTLGDGRAANRPVQREVPDPVTKITWHSWVEVHPETARELNVREGEILRLTSPHGVIEAPAYLYPGIHPQMLAVPMGLGHTEYGQFATGAGVNPLDLLGPDAVDGFLPYLGTRVKAVQTGGYHRVAKTEGNVRQLGRGIASAMTAGQVAKGLNLREAERQEGHAEHEINPPLEVAAIEGFRQGQQEKIKLGAYAQEHPLWGMTIDLAKCTGCSACVTACYMENNIPTVGEREVLKGREMSWMRIERYYEGGEDGEPLETRFVPMLCQHCDNAPCEPVCPVFAAYHTPDGLNGQVYNRCVGTRYCANNCPYKVRYFNWFAYGKQAFPEPLHLQLNPDVVVRARGVMEKCTMCVQRIRGAQHQARLENRTVADGEFTTACAQTCPSGAILFGNRADPATAVAQSATSRRGYHVLEEINVRPAITYLAKVTNRAEA